MKSEIIGLSDLMNKLNALEKISRGKVISTALVAGALEISNEAKVSAPYITGTLKRSIHVGGHAQETSPGFSTNDVAGQYSDVGGEEIDDDKASVLIGTNLVYAARQEFGFVGVDSLGRTYNQPAHPYLRPAFDNKKQKALEVFGRALKVLIDRAAKK